MSTFLSFLRHFGLLVSRIALGGILIAHGWNRWAYHTVANETAYLQQFATPYPQVVAWGAIVLELVGGLCLIVGLITPIVALAVLVEQILIICYTNWFRAPDLVSPDAAAAAGLEHNVALAALALLFVVYGAGAASLDRLFRRKKPAEDEDVPATTASRPTSGSYGSAGSGPGAYGSSGSGSSPYGSTGYGSTTPAARPPVPPSGTTNQSAPVGTARPS
jgi:putative oxidoreductase